MDAVIESRDKNDGKGDKAMMKRLMMAVLTGLLTVSMTSVVMAQGDPNSDSLTITITPNVDYGVDIDTDGVTMDLGTLDLYAVGQTVQPATVTILGTVSSDGSQNTGQELELTLTFEGGASPWTFDATPTTYAFGGTLDEIAVYALFTDTTMSDVPDGGVFGDSSAGFTVNPDRAGSASTDGTRFEKTAGQHTIDMDHKSPDDEAHLWMYFRLPPATSDSGAKEITLTATAVAAS